MRRILSVFLSIIILSCAAHALADTTLRLTFTGDVTLGSEELKKNKPWSFVSYAKEKGYDYFFANMADMFSHDDLTVVNLQGPLTDKNTQENKKKTYRFRGPTDFVNILLKGGIEACNLSNNHLPQDFGRQGYNNTVATLEGAGIGYFGGQTSWIWKKGDIRIAFFGFNSTAVNGNKKWLKEEIERMKADGVNAVVVVFHAGSEYSKHRTKAQETYAHMAIDYGADLVMMHHPHVVQGIEVYQNRYICYSLGNFCFGGNKDVRALETVVAGVDMTFADDGRYLGQQLTLYPANISGTGEYNNYQPVLVSGDAAQQVMQLIQLDTEFDLAPYTDEAGCAVQAYIAAQ